MEPLEKSRSTLDWAEKYRPSELSGVVGHPTLIFELKEWAKSWINNIPKNRAIVLHGRPGIGKTTTAYALANDMGWEVVELNASDQRTASIINKIVGSASRMDTFSGSKRLIIVDEADNIHGREDRGGEKAIIALIKKTNQPVILIANELFDMSVELRNACKPILFKTISQSTMYQVLKNIADKEGIKYGYGAIEKIVDNANGDLRSAINDLQAISIGKTKIEVSDVITGERDITKNVFKVLENVFKADNAINAYKSTLGMDEDPEDFIQWIDENIPVEFFRPKDIHEAFKYLSKASIYLGRVRRRRDYGMWRYASILMTTGMVVARSQVNKGYIKYQYPSLRINLKKIKNIKVIRDSIAKKIGSHCHISMSFARYNLIPFFKLMIKNEKYAVPLAALLRLSLEEISYLTGSKEDSKMVEKIYNDAQLIITKDIEYDIEVFGGFFEEMDKNEKDKNEKNKEKLKDEDVIQNGKKAQSSLFDFDN